MPRRYTLMVVDDDTLLTPETLEAHFTTRADWATLELLDGRVFSSAAAALNRAKQANAPDMILLDDYYKVSDDKEPQALALRFMVALSQELTRRDQPLPLCILHTQREVTPLTAYTFRAAGGRHVIDKADMSDFAQRVKRVWEVIEGRRWTPKPQPPTPDLGPLEARVLAYLADTTKVVHNREIAKYLSEHGDKTDDGKVSEARSRLFKKVLNPKPDERANGRSGDIVKAAIEGGHVWVPIVYREAIFRNREVVLPFDRPPRLEEKEPPLR